MSDKTGPDLALDALVAERVLGWTNVHIALSNVRGVPPGYADKQPPDRTVNFPGQGWSSFISSAWLVVEAMERRGWEWFLGRENGVPGGPYECSFRPPASLGLHVLEWPDSTWAPSAPRAICLAALKALEVADA